MLSVGSAVIGSLQFGYNTGVINAPQKVSHVRREIRLDKIHPSIKIYLEMFLPFPCQQTCLGLKKGSRQQTQWITKTNNLQINYKYTKFLKTWCKWSIIYLKVTITWPLTWVRYHPCSRFSVSLCSLITDLFKMEDNNSCIQTYQAQGHLW